MIFKDLKTPALVRDYLLKVLSRTGRRKSEQMQLFHYSDIASLRNIIESGYMWLGSTDTMNDFFEGEIIRSEQGEGKNFFACFSRAEENMAMYKMYAPSPNGAMLKLSYMDAKRIIEFQTRTKSGKVKALIVRDKKITAENIEVDVYWAAVAYKGLHDDLIRVGENTNSQIKAPLAAKELAGFIKLHGWEYEKEVRLCATTEKQLSPNEKIAIAIPEDVRMSIVTGPGFDNRQNRQAILDIKRKSVEIHDSEYDSFVDLGIGELEEIKRLKNQIIEKEKIISEQDDEIVHIKDELNKRLKDDEISELLLENEKEIKDLERMLDYLAGFSHTVSDRVKKLIAEEMNTHSIMWMKRVTDFLQQSVTSLEYVLSENYKKEIRASLKLTIGDNSIKSYVRGKNNIRSRGGELKCEELNRREVLVSDNYAYIAIVERCQKFFASGNLLNMTTKYEDDDYFFCEYGDDYMKMFVATIIMPIRIPVYYDQVSQEILGMLCIDCKDEISEWSKSYSLLCEYRGYHIIADYADSIATLMKEFSYGAK